MDRHRRQGIDGQYKLTETDLCRQFGITKHIYVKLVNMTEPGLLSASADSQNTCYNTSANFKSRFNPNLTTTINNTDFTKVIKISESTTTTTTTTTASSASVTTTNNNATTSAGATTVLTNKTIARSLISATEIETETAGAGASTAGVFNNNSELTDKTDSDESKTGTGPTECQAHDYNNGTESPSEIESETVTEVKLREAMMAQTFFVCPNGNCKFFTQYRNLFDAHLTLKHITTRSKKRRSGENTNSQKIGTFCTNTETDTDTEPIENGWKSIDIPYFDIIGAGPQVIISAISNHFIGVPPLNTALLNNDDARLQNSTPFSTAAAMTTETEGVQTSNPPSAIVVKRRRGRPRKNIVQENSNICTMFSSSSSNSATNARAISIPSTSPSPSSRKPAEKNQKITILNGSFNNRTAVINSANTITLCPAPAPEEAAETHITGSKAKLKNKAKAKNINKKTSPVVNDGNDQTSTLVCQTAIKGRKRKQKKPTGRFCTHPNCGFKLRKFEQMKTHVKTMHSISTSSTTEAPVTVTEAVPAKRKSKKTTIQAPDFGYGVTPDQLNPRPRPSYTEAMEDVSESEDEVYNGQMRNFRKVSVIHKLLTSSETEIIFENENGQEASVETNQSEIDSALVSLQKLQQSLPTFPVTDPDPSIDPVPDPNPDIDLVISPSPNIDPVNGPDHSIHPVPDLNPEIDLVISPSPNIDPVNDPDHSIDPVPDNYLTIDLAACPDPYVDPVNDPGTSINSITNPDPKNDLVTSSDPKIDLTTFPDRNINLGNESDPNTNVATDLGTDPSISLFTHPDSRTDKVINSDYATNIDAITDPGNDSIIDPAIDPDPDSNIDPVTDPDPHSNVDPVTDPDLDSNIGPVTDTDSNVAPVTDPDPDSNVGPVTDRDHDSYIDLVTDPDPDSNIDPVTDPDPGCCPINETNVDAVYQSYKNENGNETNNKAEPPTVADALQPKNDVNSDQKNDDFPKILSVYSTPFVSGPAAGLVLEALTETCPVSSPPPPSPPLIDLTVSSPESCTEVETENELNESKNVVYDADLDLMDETEFLSKIAADVEMDLQSICDAPTQSVSYVAVDTEKKKGSYAKKQGNPEPSQPVLKPKLFQPWVDTPSQIQTQPPPLSSYLEPKPESEQHPQLTSDRVSFPPSPCNNVFNYNHNCGSRTRTVCADDKDDGNLRSHSMCLGQQFHSCCIHPHPTVLMTNMEAQPPLCQFQFGPGCQSQNVDTLQQSHLHQQTQQYYPVNLLHNMNQALAVPVPVPLQVPMPSTYVLLPLPTSQLLPTQPPAPSRAISPSSTLGSSTNSTTTD